MRPITNHPPHELEAIFAAWGERPYWARVLGKALYGRGIHAFSEIEDLPKRIAARLNGEFNIPTLRRKEALKSIDGTQKFLFELPDGLAVESVLIPDVGRKSGNRSLCISSQVGCAMGCVFCLTGKSGLKRNLAVWEIIEQVREVQHLTGEVVTHIVYMGMGEPLHNLENVLSSIRALTSVHGGKLPESRITVSTSGLLPGLERLAQETNVRLALTLSAAQDQLRTELMPVNKKYPVAAVLETLRKLPLKKHREIFIEYVMLSGVNDDTHHADELAELLKDLPCKINLIPFNEIPGFPYRRPTQDRLFSFLRHLKGKGLATSIRQARGQEILAACGQLSNLPKIENPPFSFTPRSQNFLSSTPGDL